MTRTETDQARKALAGRGYLPAEPRTRPLSGAPRAAYQLALALAAGLALTAAILIAGMALARASGSGPDECFPRAAWDANDGRRPCVEVRRVYEDGSFTVRVSDANGTVRYTRGVSVPNGYEDRR